MMARFACLKFSHLVLAGLAALTLSACSSTQATDPNDPLEGYNRVMFAVNDAVDQAVLRPVAKGYRFAVPQPARTGVRNFLRNLRAPVNLANEALQGDLAGVENVLVRTSVNTLIGVGGLIDVAGMEGYPYEQEDFGQTLGVWGVGHGAYVILPLMGPSSLRDGTGMLVDGFMDPLRWYLFNTEREGWHYARLGMTVIDSREELLDALDDLRRNSFDYYAATRSAYLQRREALVNDMDPGVGGVAIPDYD
ncbi:MlaA family lipoprotein [Micavibrio aeruginosavorus]|uniref:VacJ like lipofamily protein n=1 Tax=Micavibrio aeruginosavorus (strain ARL-13) TaxID=856793 RepID=G2KP32_MICAA|nr:VacJ family lipoprotein [Micavibrio aeruginosavorus]AEP08540.1 vacJ like lipofamily protein [Micavibrio aeruginosavorus ARL-13]